MKIEEYTVNRRQKKKNISNYLLVYYSVRNDLTGELTRNNLTGSYIKIID